MDTRRRTGFYFAYGSNMNRVVLCDRRRIAPMSQRRAFVNDWRLVFEHPGFPWIEPVFATIRPAPGAIIHGVLYELVPDDVTRLGATEGHNYKRQQITVTAEDAGEIDAYTYISRKHLPDKCPSRRYLNIVVTGAREHGLPADYIRQLSQTRTRHIPLVSSLSGVVLRILTVMAAKGRRINIFGFKLGVGDVDK